MSLLLALACSSADVTVSGIDDFGPVRSATALDVVVDDVWVVGLGSQGSFSASTVLLSDEADYCGLEQQWYEDSEPLWEDMVAGREEDDPLCDEGTSAIDVGTADYPHTTPRHSVALSICPGGVCDWADVVAGTYDLYSPSDPYVAGTITYTDAKVTTEAGDFDEDACHTTSAFDDRVDASYTLYDLDDGTLTLDSVGVGGSVKGSFDAIIYEKATEVGNVRGDFTTDWCEIHVSTMVIL